MSDLKRRRVRPTYSICYSARAQTLSCARNLPSVFALIFASVFIGGGPSVFEPFSAGGYFPSAMWASGLLRLDNDGKIWGSSPNLSNFHLNEVINDTTLINERGRFC
jgi:hypothetical protein